MDIEPDESTTEVITSSPCPQCGCMQWEVVDTATKYLTSEFDDVTIVYAQCVNCEYEREWIED